MKAIGRFTDLAFKLYCLLIYGEGELAYIRRRGLKFIVSSTPLRHRFGKNSKQMADAFRAMEKMGYIHSFDIQAAEYYFFLVVPNWLQVKDVTYQPINPAVAVSTSNDNSEVANGKT